MKLKLKTKRICTLWTKEYNIFFRDNGTYTISTGDENIHLSRFVFPWPSSVWDIHDPDERSGQLRDSLFF